MSSSMNLHGKAECRTTGPVLSTGALPSVETVTACADRVLVVAGRAAFVTFLGLVVTAALASGVAATLYNSPSYLEAT